MKRLIIIGTILLSSINGYGGCKINVFVHNSSEQDIRVHNAHSVSGIWKESAVKSKRGSWRALSRGHWMNGTFVGGHFILRKKETLGDQYTATFGCKGKRRYRIMYTCGPDNIAFTKYYPSPTGWTKSQNITIKLGSECEQIDSREQTFMNPIINTRRVDWCKTWGQGCGEPAATYFCEKQGFIRARVWEEAKNIGNTLVLGDNRICTPSDCDGFKSITCVK